MQKNDMLVQFLKDQTCLTLATSIKTIPYCASCFYSFWEKEMSLIFKSDPSTRHIREARQNNQVSGTIVPDRLIRTAVQGIQFSGVFLAPDGRIAAKAQTLYYKKFPFALFHNGELWMIRLTEVKMTDSVNGQRKKYYWKRSGVLS